MNDIQCLNGQKPNGVSIRNPGLFGAVYSDRIDGHTKCNDIMSLLAEQPVGMDLRRMLQVTPMVAHYLRFL